MVVKACPRCSRLMWVKEEDVVYPDELTMQMTCPHCRQTVRLKLVTQGANAAGPKMGH